MCAAHTRHLPLLSLLQHCLLLRNALSNSAQTAHMPAPVLALATVLSSICQLSWQANLTCLMLFQILPPWQIDEGNMVGMISIKDVVHVMLKEHRCAPFSWLFFPHRNVVASASSCARHAQGAQARSFCRLALPVVTLFVAHC